MKLALIGYGKMGRAIEHIALQRGHTIIMKIGRANLHELTVDNLSGADAAIEFTSPESAVANIRTCIDAGVPVICGTTGWMAQLEDMKQYCEANKGCFIYASNFSVGVNIFFEVNKRLASLMASQPAYEVSIEEIHHTQKKDAPSGTAISLANQVLEESKIKDHWVNGPDSDPKALVITSRREDPAPGTHTVAYRSPIDDISITHTAHNRDGFATGAVIAAEFAKGKSGCFTMKEVLDL
jgi:4-hydroxy-tetrahydrodipicolinate reductase